MSVIALHFIFSYLSEKSESVAKIATIKGVKGKISSSNRKNKKWKFTPNNKNIPPVHAGQKGETIQPGTKKGDNYCARSSGIKTSKRISANDLARYQWRCKGKKSMRK